MVPVRQAPHPGPVPHRTVHRGDGPPARVPGHSRNARRRFRPRGQQPGGGRIPAVNALGDACQTLLSSLARLAGDEISPQQFTALDALRREIGPQAAALSPLALADHEDALSAWLSHHGVVRDQTIAPPLAAAGVDVGWCERALGALAGSALEPGLEWVASTLSVATLLSEVKESTRRISELVAAIKSYSQMDRASMQQTDVTDGIESALVMLGHKLPGGITVVRDYGAAFRPSGPPASSIRCGPRHRQRARRHERVRDAPADDPGRQDGITVEVGDTGPGMSPQVAARTFDAFYTTKDTGQGTGLGLDIARRTVVERHGGSITIDSRPGNTVLRVRLPARAAGR